MWQRDCGVKEFVAYARDDAMPEALKELQRVRCPEDVRVWRLYLKRKLAKMLVAGESYSDVIRISY